METQKNKKSFKEIMAYIWWERPGLFLLVCTIAFLLVLGLAALIDPMTSLISFGVFFVIWVVLLIAWAVNYMPEPMPKSEIIRATAISMLVTIVVSVIVMFSSGGSETDGVICRNCNGEGLAPWYGELKKCVVCGGKGVLELD